MYRARSPSPKTGVADFEILVDGLFWIFSSFFSSQKVTRVVVLSGPAKVERLCSRFPHPCFHPARLSLAYLAVHKYPPLLLLCMQCIFESRI